MTPSSARAPSIASSRQSRGFTLIELVITLGVLALVTTIVVGFLIHSSAQKALISNEVSSTGMARSALDMMSRDLRCAGFNTDITYATPQPPIAYVDSMQVIMCADLQPFPDTSAAARGIPLAYDPNGSPRPKPLVGTSWTPSTRYRTGAELVRWTLDLNNDGIVDATDLADPDAADANHTSNPDDYELCREVYGDSTGGVKGNNGGTRERIALIMKPGGTRPPLFRVYLTGDTQPWNWSNGPIPATRLNEIVRIEMNVVASSANKNFSGRFAETPLTTSVSSIRNAPNYKFQSYTVSGVVYNDANKNRVKDGTETGISGCVVTLGGYMSQNTGTSGSFSFGVPAGTYVLKHTPPANYGVFTTPDSFIVTVGPSVVKNFADTAQAGGWLTLTVWNDQDHDKTIDGAEKGLASVVVTVNGLDDVYVTDDNGLASVFIPVGTFQVHAALPDSFVYSTSDPLSVTMANGQTKTGKTGMYIFDSGVVAGTVFNDTNNNGTADTGEKTVPGATISCTLPDSTYLYTLSDSKGDYALRLPVNDPPHTTPYSVQCSPPTGYASGSKMVKTGIYVKLNQIVSNQDFAIGSFARTEYQFNEPIASMTLADFIEDDWVLSSTSFAHQDIDMATGSDDGTQSQLEVWFNRWDKAPPYQGAPDSKRASTQSVMALAADTLNAGSGGISRPDLICGPTYSSGVNWSLQFMQDGTGNEGFLPPATSKSYCTADLGDVVSIVTVPSSTAGGTPEILVGTRTTGTSGTIESWTSASHSNPSFTRQQTIPATGGVPGGTLGKVVGMVIGDWITGLAGNELLVGMQTGYYSGQIMIFKKVAGVWTYAWSQTLLSDAVTSICGADVDGDGRMDIVVGTQTGSTTGRLHWYKNKGGGSPSFDPAVIKNGPGIITAVDGGDFSGDGHDDVVIGWRDSDTSFGGGLQVWYTDTKTLPASGNDPSSGAIKNWVSTLLLAHLNWGVYPQDPSATKLLDIVAITRKNTNTSGINTLVR